MAAKAGGTVATRQLAIAERLEQSVKRDKALFANLKQLHELGLLNKAERVEMRKIEVRMISNSDRVIKLRAWAGEGGYNAGKSRRNADGRGQAVDDDDRQARGSSGRKRA